MPCIAMAQPLSLVYTGVLYMSSVNVYSQADVETYEQDDGMERPRRIRDFKSRDGVDPAMPRHDAQC